MQDKLISAATDYVRSLFEGNADGHGFDHTMRVYRNAMRIAQSEDCDRQIAALAALLHDADDPKLFCTSDNANARAFLNAHVPDREMHETIIAAVNSVSFSRNRDKKPDSIEGQVVQDADRLDAIGAVGIARTFAFGGSHGRDLADSLRHFHEKLLLLTEMMNTQTAKAMASERHEYMLGFLREWERETGEDSASP